MVEVQKEQKALETKLDNLFFQDLGYIILVFFFIILNV